MVLDSLGPFFIRHEANDPVRSRRATQTFEQRDLLIDYYML